MVPTRRTGSRRSGSTCGSRTARTAPFQLQVLTLTATGCPTWAASSTSDVSPVRIARYAAGLTASPQAGRVLAAPPEWVLDRFSRHVPPQETPDGRCPTRQGPPPPLDPVVEHGPPPPARDAVVDRPPPPTLDPVVEHGPTPPPAFGLLVLAALVIICAGLKTVSSIVAPTFLVLTLVITVQPVGGLLQRRGRRDRWPASSCWLSVYALLVAVLASRCGRSAG